jgi:hypothetical protein
MIESIMECHDADNDPSHSSWLQHSNESRHGQLAAVSERVALAQAKRASMSQEQQY